MWVLWSKFYFIRNSFWIVYDVRSERGISIDADSGPLRYVLWCCDDICHQPFTFIQIGSGHASTGWIVEWHKIGYLKTTHNSLYEQKSKSMISSEPIYYLVFTLYHEIPCRCTEGPRILWFLVLKRNHEMQGSWILRTVFSLRPQNRSKKILKSFSSLFFMKFWFFPIKKAFPNLHAYWIACNFHS